MNTVTLLQKISKVGTSHAAQWFWDHARAGFPWSLHTPATAHQAPTLSAWPLTRAPTLAGSAQLFCRLLWRSPFRRMGAGILSWCPPSLQCNFPCTWQVFLKNVYFVFGSKFYFHGKHSISFGPPHTPLFWGYRKEKKEAVLSLFCHLIIASPWQIFKCKSA